MKVFAFTSSFTETVRLFGGLSSDLAMIPGTKTYCLNIFTFMNIWSQITAIKVHELNSNYNI